MIKSFCICLTKAGNRCRRTPSKNNRCHQHQKSEHLYEQPTTSGAKKSKGSLIEPDNHCLSCYEDFPKAGKIIPCACGVKVCKKCVKRYILTKAQKAHCMSCKSNYTTSFCFKNLGRAYTNTEYKDHMKKTLFDREKSRFPETMPAATFAKRVKQFNLEKKQGDEEIDKIHKKINKIRKKYRYYSIKQDIRKIHYKRPDCKPLSNLEIKFIKETNEKIEFIDNLIKPLSKKITDIWKNQRTHRESIYGTGIAPQHTIKAEMKPKHLFVHKCSVDDCEGFLTEKWICELCNNKTCCRCLETMGDSHVCNQDDVKSAKLIKSTTRNCPGCATSIHKINGCDQMWCTQCHVAFSYKTGEKINSRIHNPHFFQWLQENPEQQQENQPLTIEQIAQRLTPQEIIDLAETWRVSIYNNAQIRATTGLNLTIFKLNMLAIHFKDTVLNGTRNDVHNNEDIRIKYMLKDLNKTQMEGMLYKREKKQNKEIEFTQIYEFMFAKMNECFIRVKRKTKPDSIRKILKEVDNVRIYCNKELKKISKTYGNKPMEITPKYNVRYIQTTEKQLENHEIPSEYTESQLKNKCLVDLMKIAKDLNRKNVSSKGKWGLIHLILLKELPVQTVSVLHTNDLILHKFGVIV